MDQPPALPSNGFESVLERLRSHRREWSRVGPKVSGTRLLLGLATILGFCLVGALVVYAAAREPPEVAHRIASVWRSATGLFTLLAMAAVMWPLFREVGTEDATLKRAQERAAVNFGLVKDLVRFDRRTLERVRAGLDAEYQLLENRKPLLSRFFAGVFLLALAVQARRDGLKVPASLTDSTSIVDFLDRVTSSPSGLLAIAAGAVLLSLVLRFYDAVNILRCHCSLLSTAIQQRQTDEDGNPTDDPRPKIGLEPALSGATAPAPRPDRVGPNTILVAPKQ